MVLGNEVTWGGPNGARSWGSDLSGHARDCATQVNGMLDEVRSAMQATPQQVTQDEADAIRRELRLIAMNI